jgi:hypothetical protein
MTHEQVLRQEIRKALQDIGPDAVRQGMKSFDHRPRMSYTTCFVGYASGRGLLGRLFFPYLSTVADRLGCQWSSLTVLSYAYENDTALLKEEAILFLAEHGSAKEKNVQKNGDRVHAHA